MSRLKDSLEDSPIVMKNGYSYFVHPLTDGVPRMDPEILREVIFWMQNVGDFRCDLILAPESMGIPLAVPLSLKLGIPYSVIRKRSYGLDGEITLHQKTGYSQSQMTINGITKGTRVVLVDDVISTGGTLNAIVEALQTAEAVIVDILIPINKSGCNPPRLERSNIKVKTMYSVSIRNNRVVVTD